MFIVIVINIFRTLFLRRLSKKTGSVSADSIFGDAPYADLAEKRSLSGLGNRLNLPKVGGVLEERVCLPPVGGVIDAGRPGLPSLEALLGEKRME